MDMTGQHSIVFSDEDDSYESEILSGFLPPFNDESYFLSPSKGEQCFPSSSFDWGAEGDGNALATGTNKNDVLLLPSADDNTLRSHGASFPEGFQQSITMRRNCPSLYSAQPPHAAAQVHDFDAVPQSVYKSGVSLLPPMDTAPLMSTVDNESATLYDELIQAQADYAVMQQLFSTSVADTIFPGGAAFPPSSTNMMCGASSLGFCYDHQQPQLQLDQVHSQMMQVPLFGYQQQLKQGVPHMDPIQPHCGFVASGVEERNNIAQKIITGHPTRLSIPSDEQFLDPVHNFLRSACIEVFVSGSEYNAVGRGRGSKLHQIGQVGLRCVYCKHIHRSKRANQAVSYPSKTANIFESVRNYQRTHLEACEYIPSELKKKYRELVRQSYRKIHLKYIKVYFAEAACEIGMVQTPNGLFFGAPPNTSGKPSKKLLAIMSMAENPAASEDVRDLIFPKVDERLENSKFSHIASMNTRQVIANCRREKAVFVYPSDFPTLSDFRYVLYHQFVACRPPNTVLNRRKAKPEKWETLSGLCCKFCAKAYPGNHYHKGMYFPLDLESLYDSSFSHNLTCHIMTCQHAPLETKEALDELQRLAVEHGVITKRGTKKVFMKKLWDRIANYYPTP
jgi:hypothetical protein